MPRALIFGANGFVGRYLTKELADYGYEVIGSDVAERPAHNGLSGYCHGTLLDADRVSKVISSTNPDVIVNLAAISSVGQSWKMPALTMQVNVVGTLNVLDAARSMAEPPKILLVGSSEEYTPSDRPLRETDPLDATNPYGISKVTQEHFAELYGERYGLRIYRTRSFNHTGPGQSTKFVIPSWCKQVADIEKSGKSGVMYVGNLDVARDFSDVRDVVRTYRMILESDYVGEVFNVGSGKALLLRDILCMITSLSSQEISVEQDRSLFRPGDTPYICADITAISSKVGLISKYPLSEVMRDLYQGFLKNEG